MLYVLRFVERGKEPHEAKSKQRYDIAGAIRIAAPDARITFGVGRLYVEADRDIGAVIADVHGVISYSPAERCDLGDLEDRAVEVARGVIREGMSFRVDVKRQGRHGFRSRDEAARLGERILASVPGSRVDLTRPDVVIAVEIRDRACVVCAGVLPGIDARPVGDGAASGPEPRPAAARSTAEGGEPRFIVDAMLGTLASRLRALGFDTVWRRDTADSLILREARAEGRIVLSQDRELCQIGGASACFVAGKTADDQLAEVLRRFDLTPSEARLFTRCSICNTLLERVDKARVAHRLPPLVAAHHDEIWTCAACDKLYWKGAHYDDLRQALFPR